MEQRKNKRVRFPVEFKASAVDLCLSSNKRVSMVASELGIQTPTLYSWIKMSKKNKSREPENCIGNDDTLSLKKEIFELRKQLASVQEEAEILKKCIAFFTKK